ncbi:hypothetical protein ABIA35_000463 [Catenulispora sp. MAP12-49]
MIAVALGLLSLVVLIATGVAASSTGGDHLTFLGLGVQTTTAQVFLTGAIFGWVFVIALWLLRLGIHRSGTRCAELAARRSRRASQWLGFSQDDADADGWGGWDEWGSGSGSSSGAGSGSGFVGWRAGSDGIGWKAGGERFQAGPVRDRDGARDNACGDGRDGTLPDGIVGRTGATGHGRGTPWRPDGGADKTYRAVAGASEQPGPLGGGHPPRPVTRGLPGPGMDGRAQRRQIGGGPGPVPGEDRGTEGERRPGEGRQ